MQLFLKTLTGKHVTIEVEPDDRVQEMYSQASAKLGVEESKLRIILLGEHLDDKTALIASLRLHHVACIHVVIVQDGTKE